MRLANGLITLPLVCALFLLACAKPVPPERSAYVGEWQEKTMYLLITQDGSVRYKRINGGASTEVSGPLKAFVGNNFQVGFGPLSTTFVVSQPPRRSGDRWTMVVDGLELVRTGQ